MVRQGLTVFGDTWASILGVYENSSCPVSARLQKPISLSTWRGR